MGWLSARSPSLFQNVVLKLVTLEGNVYRYTRSEAIAENLMNLLTVVAHECPEQDWPQLVHQVRRGEARRGEARRGSVGVRHETGGS